MMMMSTPVRAMRHGVMSATPMQDTRPRVVTRPTPYAASTTKVSVMMVGATMIATTPEKAAEKAAKLRERVLRLQNRGDGQSEKSEQQRSTRNARSALPVIGSAPTVLRPLLVHRADPPIDVAIIEKYSTSLYGCRTLAALLARFAEQSLASTVLIAP
jgi:hypothetical protein